MLEQKIEALTAAVMELTKAIKAEASNYDMPAADVPPEVPKAEKPKATKPKAEPKAEPTLKEAVNKVVEYDVMAKAFKDYITAKGRDEAVQLLATFDAKTLKDVPEAKWGMMMAAIS